MATQEITISELELADELLADMVLPVESPTATKSTTLKQIKAWLGSSLPTGFILPAVGITEDERFTLLDGKTLAKEGTYLGFYNKVQEQVQKGNWFACSEEEFQADVQKYGQCGRFVITPEYVRIPKITHFIGATITLSEIGKTYAESLPNIKATATLGCEYALNENTGSSGAIKLSKRGIRNANSLDGGTFVEFDAHESNQIYQDGAKVQPDHTRFPYYMVVSTERQTAPISIDINKVQQDIALKADKNLANTIPNKNFINKSIGWGLPDLTAGIKLPARTAVPANGFIYIIIGRTVEGYVDAKIDNVPVFHTGGSYNQEVYPFIPISKGGICNYVTTFYPCKGE